MSAILKAHRIMRVNRAHPGVFTRYHRGDPGFLDGLWNGIKGAAVGFLSGGPAGAIAGGATGFVGGLKKKTGAKLPVLSPAVNVATAGTAGLVAGSLPAIQGAGLFGFGDPPRKPPLMPGADGRDSDGGIPGPGEWMDGMGVRHKSAYATGGCPAGYHVNKTGYYTRQGYVAPGSQCVKNRKRNPLNPRAASRALSRLTSTRKAMRGIDRMMNKLGGGARSVRVAHFGGARRKKGCGCK